MIPLFAHFLGHVHMSKKKREGAGESHQRCLGTAISILSLLAVLIRSARERGNKMDIMIGKELEQSIA